MGTVSLVNSRQIKSARELMGWRREELMERAGLKSPATITRIENSGRKVWDRGFASSLTGVLRAFEQVGMVFLSVDGHSPGVQLIEDKSPKRRRKS